MTWEHKPPASVSTVFLSSPKLLQVFLKNSIETRRTCFLLNSFRKHCDRKKENNLLTLDIKM